MPTGSSRLSSENLFVMTSRRLEQVYHVQASEHQLFNSVDVACGSQKNAPST